LRSSVGQKFLIGALVASLAVLGAAPAAADGKADPLGASTEQYQPETIDDFPTIDEIDLSSFEFMEAPVTAAPMVESPWIRAGDCVYKQHVDDVHVTRGEASVHGWWSKTTASDCPDKAKVKVWLQAWGCGSSGCTWVTIDENRQSRNPGSSRRVNVRDTCSATTRIGWRGVVDVDLEWLVDPSELTYGRSVNQNCRPSS
jgi:hypothetical protein